MMMHGWGNGGYAWIGWLFMLFWWILIAVALLFFIRYLASNTPHDSVREKPEESAMDILEKRYARGEIDKSEFEEKRKNLSK